MQKIIICPSFSSPKFKIIPFIKHEEKKQVNVKQTRLGIKAENETQSEIRARLREAVPEEAAAWHLRGWEGERRLGAPGGRAPGLQAGVFGRRARK